MQMRSFTPSRWASSVRPIPPWVQYGLTLLIVVGVILHGYRLGGKLYWHDEAYTSLRAAGFQGSEIGEALFSDRPFSPSDLLTFQAIKPDSTPIDTILSLAKEDPQHPPLYFLLTRWWMRLFGSSEVATRSLAVLFSLLALPVIYGLSLELFASPLAAQLTMLLLALSPFDILFAQVARQYSLLTLFTVLSSWLLLRALRPTRQLLWFWGAYVLASAGGLYSHPFFALTLVAHGAYTLSRQFLAAPSRFSLGSFAGRQRSPLADYLKAMVVTFLLYAPWAWVMATNLGRALATTSWSQGFPGWVTVTKFWVLSFTSVFFDLNVPFESPLVYLIRLPYLLLIGVAFWAVNRRSPPEASLFILTSFWVPFLLLALPDVVLSTQRSTVSRYLIPCYPAIQLAVGYWLAIAWNQFKRPFWYAMMGILLAGSLASILVSAHASTWWNRTPSLFNGEMAEYINALPAPLVISDPGVDGTNLGDLLSLAFLVDERVTFLLLSPTSSVDVAAALESADGVFFRPSGALRSRASQIAGPLEAINPAGGLWQVPAP